MGVDIDVFPVARRHIVELVLDAEVRVRLGDVVPPRPHLAVEGTVGKGVDAVDGPKVAHHHKLTSGVPLIGSEKRRLPEN